MSKVTNNTFNDRLESAVRNDNSVADECQNLIVFAYKHYKEHGDARYFAAIMNAGFRASRKEAMRKYITSHTNLKCTIDKENGDVFKFSVNSNSKLKTRTIKLPVNKETGVTTTWYEFTAEKINVDFDIDQALKSLVGRAKAAIAGEGGKKVKVGTKAHAKELLTSLEALQA